jgi:hypothetical protein
MEELLSSLDCAGRDMEILVSPKLLSQALGQRRSNLLWLTDRFALSSLRILPAAVIVEPDEIQIHILKTGT